MTAAERKVRERYPGGAAECRRSVRAAFEGEDFEVRAYVNGSLVVIGTGGTRVGAWRNAASILPPAHPVTTGQEP